MINPKNRDECERFAQVLGNVYGQLDRLVESGRPPKPPNEPYTEQEWQAHRLVCAAWLGSGEGLQVAMHLISQEQTRLYASLRKPTPE
jgi:hypothetical protein